MINEIICGASAGIAACVTGQPFDLIKTRMQTYPEKYSSITRSAKLVFHNEGILAFYVGMTSPLLGQIFSEALQFTVLDKVKAEV